MDYLPILSHPVEKIKITAKCIFPQQTKLTTTTQLFFHLLEQAITEYQTETRYSHYLLLSTSEQKQNKQQQLEFTVSKHADLHLFNVSKSSEIEFPMILRKKCMTKIIRNGLRKKQLNVNVWMPKLLRICWMNHLQKPHLFNVWIDQFKMIMNHVRHLLFGSQLVRLNHASFEHVHKIMEGIFGQHYLVMNQSISQPCIWKQQTEKMVVFHVPKQCDSSWLINGVKIEQNQWILLPCFDSEQRTLIEQINDVSSHIELYLINSGNNLSS